jgi:hypothetical protein
VLDRLSRSPASSGPVADSLASALEKGPSAGDPRIYLLAYGAIAKLLERSEREVAQYLPDDVSFYDPHFSALWQCFDPRYSGQAWDQYRSKLGVGDVTAIGHTAQRLKPIVPEFLPADDEMADVVAAIDQMSEALDQEALSAHTRDTLRECLNGIRLAIDEYKVLGVDGINKAFTSFTGTLVMDQTIQRDLKEDTANGGGLWDNWYTSPEFHHRTGPRYRNMG